MKKIITTQEELDALHEVARGEKVVITQYLYLPHKLTVFGALEIAAGLSCDLYANRSVVACDSASVVARDSVSVVARGSASVVACDSASVEACDSASVVAHDSASVVAHDSASVVAHDSASVVARDSAVVVAHDSASVVAWNSASVVARDSASVVARGSASVVARGSASVVAWGNVLVRLLSAIKTLSLYGFSILSLPHDLKFNFKKEKTVVVQRLKPQKFVERDGVKIEEGKVILFKRVSAYFWTQEGTIRETKWRIGTIVKHPNWDPTKEECGAGKFHATSRPSFADDFRSVKGDRYIAIEVDVKDLYEWPEAEYPHKIAFKSGKVLHEVDRFGRKINEE